MDRRDVAIRMLQPVVPAPAHNKARAGNPGQAALADGQEPVVVALDVGEGGGHTGIRERMRLG